tara:strand:- start:3140 stop:4045 length:906 start_codon:yes stop_codon:yes gene_type:complete
MVEQKKSKIKLSKAIVPVAGLGTRMLPATKVIPKEMLPIIDKPIIQYVVEEIINAGFDEIIFVTHSSKNSIEDHFDTSFELETTLEKRVKRSLLKEIKSISKLNGTIISIRQSEAKGLGHAILQAKEIVGNESFAVILPDRVMHKSEKNLANNLSAMRDKFIKFGKSIILLEKVSSKDSEKYGIAKLERKKNKLGINRILDIVEKPSPKKAPSNFAVVGRYIFKPEIFNYIESDSSSNKEIEITDAIKRLINSEEEVYATFLEGKCFDCGNKIGYFESIIETAINHPELGKNFKKVLKRFP